MDLQQKKELTRKNLERVLTELPKLAEKMPEIKRDFNMKNYGVYGFIKKENLSKCSTSGCLLGNAARVFVDEFTDDLFGDFNEFYYDLFCRKFFPYLYVDFDWEGLKYNRWAYLFNIHWAVTKFNDFESAIQRIKNLLDNDLECNEFCFETNQIIN